MYAPVQVEVDGDSGLAQVASGTSDVHGVSSSETNIMTRTAAAYLSSGGQRQELVNDASKEQAADLEAITSSGMRLVPYGVLGFNSSSGKIVVGIPPSEDTVVVEPAGMQYIQGGSSGASGVSGALYRW